MNTSALQNIHKELQKIADTNRHELQKDLEMKKLDLKVKQLENTVQMVEINREKEKLEEDRRELEIETKRSQQHYQKSKKLLQQKYSNRHDKFKHLIEKTITLLKQHSIDDDDSINDIEPFETLLKDAETLLQENE